MLDFFRIREGNERGRNFGLDLVRAVAILLVLLSHGRFLLPEFPGKILFANGGFFGVELFFVLSGFLIGTILVKEFDRQQATDFRLVRDFWIRRWFRTIPNYLLFLVLNLTLFQWLFVPQPFYLSYFFFLQNFMWPCPPLMAESWSLAVEEWFYLTLPLVMLGFVFLPLKKKHSLLMAFVVYVLFFSALRFYQVISSNPEWDGGVRNIVVYRLDAIGYGVLVAYFNYYHPNALRKHKNKLLALGVLLSGLSVAIFSHSLLTSLETFFNKTFLFAMTSLGFALTLPWFKELRASHRATIGLVSHISIASYSMYLIHWSFVLPLLQNYSPVRIPWLVNYVLFFVLTFVLSTAVYNYYERPLTGLREKFTERKRGYLATASTGIA